MKWFFLLNVVFNDGSSVVQNAPIEPDRMVYETKQECEAARQDAIGADAYAAGEYARRYLVSLCKADIDGD